MNEKNRKKKEILGSRDGHFHIKKPIHESIEVENTAPLFSFLRKKMREAERRKTESESETKGSILTFKGHRCYPTGFDSIVKVADFPELHLSFTIFTLKIEPEKLILTRMIR